MDQVSSQQPNPPMSRGSISLQIPRFIVPANLTLSTSSAYGQSASPDVEGFRDAFQVIPSPRAGRTQRVAPGYPLSTCAVCGKNFATEKYLKMHMGLHGTVIDQSTVADGYGQECNDDGRVGHARKGDAVEAIGEGGKGLDRVEVEMEKGRNWNRMDEGGNGWGLTNDQVNVPGRVQDRKPHSLSVPESSLSSAFSRAPGLAPIPPTRVNHEWSCDVCLKRFSQNSSYKNHMRTHSADRPYVCEVCSIGFKERYHLKKHVLFKHSDEAREQCRICGKRFKDSTAVRAHERIHSETRPYACPICGKAFKTSECLWHHANRSKTCRGGGQGGRGPARGVYKGANSDVQTRGAQGNEMVSIRGATLSCPSAPLGQMFHGPQIFHAAGRVAFGFKDGALTVEEVKLNWAGGQTGSGFQANRFDPESIPAKVNQSSGTLGLADPAVTRQSFVLSGAPCATNDDAIVELKNFSRSVDGVTNQREQPADASKNETKAVDHSHAFDENNGNLHMPSQLKVFDWVKEIEKVAGGNISPQAAAQLLAIHGSTLNKASAEEYFSHSRTCQGPVKTESKALAVAEALLMSCTGPAVQDSSDGFPTDSSLVKNGKPRPEPMNEAEKTGGDVEANPYGDTFSSERKYSPPFRVLSIHSMENEALPSYVQSRRNFSQSRSAQSATEQPGASQISPCSSRGEMPSLLPVMKPSSEASSSPRTNVFSPIAFSRLNSIDHLDRSPGSSACSANPHRKSRSRIYPESTEDSRGPWLSVEDDISTTGHLGPVTGHLVPGHSGPVTSQSVLTGDGLSLLASCAAYRPDSTSPSQQLEVKVEAEVELPDYELTAMTSPVTSPSESLYYERMKIDVAVAEHCVAEELMFMTSRVEEQDMSDVEIVVDEVVESGDGNGKNIYVGDGDEKGMNCRSGSSWVPEERNHVVDRERPYRCDQCDVGFKLKVHLKKHDLYRHSDVYRCACRVCGKRFKDSSAVRLHERTHCAERPFACSQCYKSFKTRENLWGHRHRGPCAAAAVAAGANFDPKESGSVAVGGGSLPNGDDDERLYYFDRDCVEEYVVETDGEVVVDVGSEYTSDGVIDDQSPMKRNVNTDYKAGNSNVPFDSNKSTSSADCTRSMSTDSLDSASSAVSAFNRYHACPDTVQLINDNISALSALHSKQLEHQNASDSMTSSGNISVPFKPAAPLTSGNQVPISSMPDITPRLENLTFVATPDGGVYMLLGPQDLARLFGTTDIAHILGSNSPGAASKIVNSSLESALQSVPANLDISNVKEEVNARMPLPYVHSATSEATSMNSRINASDSVQARPAFFNALPVDCYGSAQTHLLGTMPTGSLGRLPTAVVAPIQRDVRSEGEGGVAKHHLPPFESFAPTFRSPPRH